ncbi:hypothetical protein FGK63_06905 [Ruegeria sediminis]|uniref:Uncharacterized protein n=1 Tax=Ruegeria sediminis TaxID=2583820 RepID=A0ABY2X0U9_9RHOB|nr:hypothetical protein [Ruegeria sediminis]TMV08842.1 hypothetical protein FGK63_06905 [Ruegeria sediminis]
MEWLSYGAWGAFGLLVGIGLVTYASPDTRAGVGLLLVICLALSLIARGVWGWATARPEKEQADKDEG